jgi:hypothetical protein
MGKQDHLEKLNRNQIKKNFLAVWRAQWLLTPFGAFNGLAFQKFWNSLNRPPTPISDTLTLNEKDLWRK